MQKDSFKNYGFTYKYEGKSFVFHIVANSKEEAMGHAQAMAAARFEGELKSADPEQDLALMERARMLVGVSENLGLPLSEPESPEKKAAIAQVHAERFMASLDPDSLKVGDGSDGLPVWIGIDVQAQKVYKVYASGLAQGFGDGRLMILNGLQFAGWRVGQGEQVSSGGHHLLSGECGAILCEAEPSAVSQSGITPS